jgi:MFS family permease
MLAVMQLQSRFPPRERSPVWLIVPQLAASSSRACARLWGLIWKPMTMELGMAQAFSSAMAIANLVWGMAAVFAGAVADKYGAGRVIVAGAVSTMVGLYLMYVARTGTELLISGVLLGLGVSGTGITALVGAVGRAVPPEMRTQAIASLGMAAGIGGFIAFPYAHLLIEAFGWKASLLTLMVTATLMIPLAYVMSGKPQAVVSAAKPQTLTQAFSEAFATPSFWLLTAGFFVCGFHVAFSVHLPLSSPTKGLEPWVVVALDAGRHRQYHRYSISPDSQGASSRSGPD